MVNWCFFMKMKEKQLEIIEQKEITLTDEEAREFYSHKKDEVIMLDVFTIVLSLYALQNLGKK